MPARFPRACRYSSKGCFYRYGLLTRDLMEISENYSDPQMKEILDANGIDHIELEWLLDWYCTDHRRVISDQARELLLTAAERLDAQHIKIGDLEMIARVFHS